MSSPQPPRLLNQVRESIRLKHFSLSTEKSYVYYIRDFILFHDKRHPKEMGSSEIRAYLSHLAVDRHVAASTQTVALSALLFLYRQANLDGIHHLVISLLYGTGMRLMEGLRLRVKDIDFEYCQITVRDGKGQMAMAVCVSVLEALSRSTFQASPQTSLV